LYKLVANEGQIATMKANYLGGGYGYGHAKQAFYELLIERFKTEREKYHYFMNHKEEIDAILLEGAKKAHLVADEVLKRVRHKLGY